MKPTTDPKPNHEWFRFIFRVLVGLQLLLADRGLALDASRDLTQYNCQTWSRQNGLPANAINAIAQTRDGYLWFGTTAGLLRFDGIEFKLLDLHAVAAVRNSFVTSLASARSGGLWVGLQNSAFGFCDGRSFSFPSGTNAATARLDVRSFLEGQDGTLWLVAAEEVARLNRSGELEPVLKTGPDTNLALNLTCGYEDPRGRLWFGTANQGVYCWQDGKVTKLPDPKLDDTLIRCLAEDLDGQIWVGTSSGLFCYDASRQRKEISPLYEEVRALLVDRQGVVWIGTSGRGLGRYQRGTYDFLQQTDGLGSDYVNAIAEDNEGSLWVGTRNGISQISDVKFPIQRAAKDPKVQDAIAVAASPRGVWIASSGGVTRFDPKTKTYTTLSGLPDAYVKRVFEASDGDLYAVSGTHNLAVFSGGKAVATNAAPNLIAGVAEDEQGVVVSVGGKLYRAGTNYFRPYAFTNTEPPFYWILNLASGKNGVIWVACVNGIFRVKDGACQHWSAAEGLSDPEVGWICEDQDGVVWAGLESGIARLKDNQIRLIKQKDGLFDDNIYSIVPDDLGNLWVDSSRGIFRVTRQSLNDFADGKTGQVECTAFDGLNSVKVVDKTEQERVGCKTADGRIWFPDPLGVVMIDPAHVPTNLVAPPVHIERVLANGREYARSKAIVVPPDQGELEFYYQAPSYLAPQRIRFRYQLEGFDQNWVEADNRRQAFYTNLKPGRYAFHVIAANADGVWNDVGDSLAVELRPHFYQAGWFQAGGGGLIIAGLIAVYRVRVRARQRKERKLQEEREELEHRVAARTSELAESLALLNATLDSTADGILVVNPRGEKVLQNQRTAELLEIPPAMAENSDNAAQLQMVVNQVAEPRRFLEKVRHYYSHPDESGQDEIELKNGTILVRITAPVRGQDGRRFGRIWSFRDVTQSRQYEAALRESQALYHSLVEQLPGGVFRKDAAGRYVYANTSFCRIVELPAEQILGKTAIELVTDLSPPTKPRRPLAQNLGRQGMKHHELIMRTGQQITVEDEYCSLDGRRNYYHTVKSPVFDPDRKIVGTQGILIDVTARKLAETALAYERDLLRELLDNAPDQIYFKDLQSRFIRHSQAQAEKFGLKQIDDIAGKTDFDFFDEAHARSAFEDEQQIIRTGQPITGKVEKELWKDGRETWVLTNKMPLRDHAGHIIGTFGISKDITAIKQAEAELAYERDLLRTLLENSPDFIYFKDAQSRFLKSSTAHARQFGLASADELAGKSDFDFFSEKHARQAFADEQQIIRTGQPMIGKIEKESWKDGRRENWVLTTKMPLRNKAGDIIGTFGISKDITAIKEAEAKLTEVHRQLLETSRLAGMAEVATNVLHNVGNVLNSVNVSATVLLDGSRKSKIPFLAKVAALLGEHATDLGTFITADIKGRQVPGYLHQLAGQLAGSRNKPSRNWNCSAKIWSTSWTSWRCSRATPKFPASPKRSGWRIWPKTPWP